MKGGACECVCEGVEVVIRGPPLPSFAFALPSFFPLRFRLCALPPHGLSAAVVVVCYLDTAASSHFFFSGASHTHKASEREELRRRMALQTVGVRASLILDT